MSLKAGPSSLQPEVKDVLASGRVYLLGCSLLLSELDHSAGLRPTCRLTLKVLHPEEGLNINVLL